MPAPSARRSVTTITELAGSNIKASITHLVRAADAIARRLDRDQPQEAMRHPASFLEKSSSSPMDSSASTSPLPQPATSQDSPPSRRPSIPWTATHLLPPWLPLPSASTLDPLLDSPALIQSLLSVLTGLLLSADTNATAPRIFALTLLKLAILSLPFGILNLGLNGALDLSRPCLRALGLPLLGLGALALWFLPRETWIVVGAAMAILGVIYPFTARWTTLSRAFFAAAIAGVAALVGASAGGSTPFLECRGSERCRSEGLYSETKSVLWFIVGNLLWGFGDRFAQASGEVRAEEMAGCSRGGRGLAGLAWERPLLVLWALGAGQTGAFVGAGLAARVVGPAYFIFCVGAMAVSMVLKLRNADLGDYESCAWWLSRWAMITGGLTGIGLLVDYLPRVL